MGYVLAVVEDICAAGMFEAETLALAQEISCRSSLTLDDISGPADPQEKRWIATELLLPNPEETTNLAVQEAAELLARADAEPGGAFSRYYVSLLVASLEALEEAAVMNGADGEAVLLENGAFGDRVSSSRRQHGPALQRAVIL